MFFTNHPTIRRRIAQILTSSYNNPHNEVNSGLQRCIRYTIPPDTHVRTETSGTCQYVSQIPVLARSTERIIFSSRAWLIASVYFEHRACHSNKKVPVSDLVSDIPEFYDVRARGRNKRGRQPEYLLTHFCHIILL
jgi:hypothetical protein